MDKQPAETKRKGGRPPGSPNKATAEVRAAIAEMMQRAAPQMADWLAQVAATDPAKAFDLALKAAEYHIPKLARTEHVGENGGPVQHSVVERRIVRADHSDR